MPRGKNAAKQPSLFDSSGGAVRSTGKPQRAAAKSKKTNVRTAASRVTVSAHTRRYPGFGGKKK